jgi:hypothetical protein
MIEMVFGEMDRLDIEISLVPALRESQQPRLLIATV